MWVGSSDSHGLKSTYNGPSTLCSLETPALGIGAKNCVRPSLHKSKWLPENFAVRPNLLKDDPDTVQGIWILPKLLQGALKTMHLGPKMMATCCWPRWPPWPTTAPPVPTQESTPRQKYLKGIIIMIKNTLAKVKLFHGGANVVCLRKIDVAISTPL